MPRSRFQAVLVVAAVALLGVWAKGFFVDGRRELASYEFPDRLTPREAIEVYARSVEPILNAKCAQCHTDTEERPLILYRFPVLAQLFGRDYVDDEIRRGRVQFDFSEGFPTSRIGASMEHIQGLREAVVNDTMPPWEYAVARPRTFLNEREERILLDWAEKASEAARRELAKGSQARLRVGDLERLAEALISACPVVDDADLEDQLACSQNLGRLDLLREGMTDPILWGYQKEEGDYRFAHTHSARFNPRVWRMLYASLFMFEPGFRVVREGDTAVLHLPVVFRRDLDAGDYPYPFWHRPSKWDGYLRSTQLLLVARQGRIIGALRGFEKRGPPTEPRPWDQRWEWEGDAGASKPAPSRLYTRVFSASNPFVPDLDAAYRKLALALLDADCMECHNPDNPANMKMLEFFNYPNQALTARNRLVAALDENAMPPLDGIRDREKRARMLALALEFQAVADRALSHDEGRVEDLFARPLVPAGS